MPLVLTDPGMLKLVLRLVGQDTSSPTWSVGLFANNYPPTRTTTLGDFVEPIWPSYSRSALDPTQWQAPGIVVDRAETVYGSSPIEWNNDGSAQTVYGYFVLDTADSGVMWAEAFATPRTMGPTAILLLDLTNYVRNDPSPP